MTQFQYAVTYDPGGSQPQDITDFAERIEVIDIGTGEWKSCKIRLNAQDGQFITRSTSLSGAATPILDQFDRIEIVIIDRNTQTYIETFEVDILKPTQNVQQGAILEVEMIGREWNLGRVPVAKQFFFESGFIVLRDLTDFYNDGDSKGPEQPIVFGHTADSGSGGGNNLPKWTANEYTYNVSEQMCYDAQMELVDRLGNSVASGGGDDFFDLYYKTRQADKVNLELQAFSSGLNPDGEQQFFINLNDTLAVNPGEEEGGIESVQGSITATWGNQEGTIPTETSQFNGELEAWQLFPAHIAGETYPQDSIIQVPGTNDVESDNFHYQANKNTSLAPPVPPATSNADWDQLLFSQFVSVPNYSVWTNGQVQAWRNCCANPNGTLGQPLSFGHVMCWDGNQVVRDGLFKRTWVDVFADQPSSVPTQYKFSGQFRRGFRVYVTNPATGAYTGLEGNVIQYFGPADTDFVVFFTPLDRNMIANDDEAKVYSVLAESNIAGLPVWVNFRNYAKNTRVQLGGVAYQAKQQIRRQQSSDPTATSLWFTLPAVQDFTANYEQGNECYHPITSIANVAGAVNKPITGGGNYGTNSAVEFEYQYEANDSREFTTPDFFGVGAWIDWRVPFPSNSYNGQVIGGLYGPNDPIDGLNPKIEPVTFDSNNMHFTRHGKIGFNNRESEDLGPGDGIQFWTKFRWSYKKDGSGELINRGNFSCRCIMYDTSDNVVMQDFTIPFNNLWAQINIPFSGFKAYRARTPLSQGQIAQFTVLQELEIIERFEYKNIVKICLQWLGPYEKQGRYGPQEIFNNATPNVQEVVQDIFEQVTTILETAYNVKWAIDTFGFTKTMLSVSPEIKTSTPLGRVIVPRFFQEPFIANKYQLDQSNLSRLEISQFRHKQYEVVTEGTTDLHFGEFFFLENSVLVNDSDRELVNIRAWSAATAYVPGDDVQDGGVAYRCVNANTNDQPPSANWVTLPIPVPNTIKLVAKKIRYVIDKPPSGPGGFLRYITGIRRFEP